MSGITKGTVIESFEQLEYGLRNWKSFVDRDTYDVGGMMALFCACLENLRNNVLSDELADCAAALSEQEREFLKAMADCR